MRSVRTTEAVDVPCAVIAAGPFGDIKNYGNRNFCLSWYPLGLRANSSALASPAPRSTERRRAVAPGRGNTGPIANAAALDRAYPRTHCDAAAAGGWVFAAGRGLLSDPGASLHRRADFGIFRRGSYVSVDTGKYAWAPWLAKTLANTLV